jgi:hypothetical protein
MYSVQFKKGAPPAPNERTEMKSLPLFFSIPLSIAPMSVQQGARERDEDIYQKIPDAQRELLRRTVEELIDAEKSGDWRVVFQLDGKRSSQTEDDFVKEMQHRKLLREFIPLSLTFLPPENEWIFEGCANFDGDPKSVGKYSTIHAGWKDSRWHLSGVAIEMFEKGKIRKCVIPRAKSGAGGTP